MEESKSLCLSIPQTIGQIPRQKQFIRNKEYNHVKDKKWRRVNPSVVQKKESDVWSNTASKMIECTKVQESNETTSTYMIVVLPSQKDQK